MAGERDKTVTEFLRKVEKFFEKKKKREVSSRIDAKLFVKAFA